MCASDTERSEKYSKTRSSFDSLKLEEKAVFLVESTIKAVVQGMQEAGDVAAEALKNMSADFKEAADGAGADDDEGEKSESNHAKASKPKASKKKKESGGSPKSGEKESE